MDNKGLMSNFGKGFISDIVLKIRLTINLLKDERVTGWYKLVPVVCLIYLIAPLDFLFGPVDDALILYLGMDWFISLCPEDIVREHTEKIQGKSTGQAPGKVVDAEFKEDK